MPRKQSTTYFSTTKCRRCVQTSSRCNGRERCQHCTKSRRSCIYPNTAAGTTQELARGAKEGSRIPIEIPVLSEGIAAISRNPPTTPQQLPGVQRGLGRPNDRLKQPAPVEAVQEPRVQVKPLPSSNDKKIAPIDRGAKRKEPRAPSDSGGPPAKKTCRAPKPLSFTRTTTESSTQTSAAELKCACKARPMMTGSVDGSLAYLEALEIGERTLEDHEIVTPLEKLSYMARDYNNVSDKKKYPYNLTLVELPCIRKKDSELTSIEMKLLGILNPLLGIQRGISFYDKILFEGIDLNKQTATRAIVARLACQFVFEGISLFDLQECDIQHKVLEKLGISSARIRENFVQATRAHIVSAYRKRRDAIFKIDRANSMFGSLQSRMEARSEAFTEELRTTLVLLVGDTKEIENIHGVITRLVSDLSLEFMVHQHPSTQQGYGGERAFLPIYAKINDRFDPMEHEVEGPPEFIGPNIQLKDLVGKPILMTTMFGVKSMSPDPEAKQRVRYRAKVWLWPSVPAKESMASMAASTAAEDLATRRRNHSAPGIHMQKILHILESNRAEDGGAFTQDSPYNPDCFSDETYATARRDSFTQETSACGQNSTETQETIGAEVIPSKTVTENPKSPANQISQAHQNSPDGKCIPKLSQDAKDPILSNAN